MIGFIAIGGGTDNEGSKCGKQTEPPASVLTPLFSIFILNRAFIRESKLLALKSDPLLLFTRLLTFGLSVLLVMREGDWVRFSVVCAAADKRPVSLLNNEEPMPKLLVNGDTVGFETGLDELLLMAVDCCCFSFGGIS